jgi:hypothetical protein
MDGDPSGELAEIAFRASLEKGDLAAAERSLAALRRASPERAEAAARALEQWRAAKEGDSGVAGGSP